MKEMNFEIGHFIPLKDIYGNVKNGVGEVFDNQSKKWLFSIDKAMNIKIFEPICPHQGLSIKESNGNFFCTGHKWIFDKDGKNELEGGSKLNEIDFLTDGDRITLKYNQAKNLTRLTQ
jgi:nitrite reductase/ring-hydroxylating ferredoxin subunit